MLRHLYTAKFIFPYYSSIYLQVSLSPNLRNNQTCNVELRCRSVLLAPFRQNSLMNSYFTLSLRQSSVRKQDYNFYIIDLSILCFPIQLLYNSSSYIINHFTSKAQNAQGFQTLTWSRVFSLSHSLLQKIFLTNSFIFLLNL